MSEHIDKYKRRLSRNGNHVGEVYANNTIAFIESTFHASPTFRILEVNSTEFPLIKNIDARIVGVERLGSLYEVLFRPLQGLNVGSYVKFDDDTWIISDVWGSTNHQQKVMVQKCNRVAKWKDKNDVTHRIDSIVSQSPIGSKSNQGKFGIEWNKYDVSLPVGQLFVYCEHNTYSKSIEVNHRFIFGKNSYEVIGIDDISLINENGYGIIQFIVKVTTKRDEDDFENHIAHNEYESSSNAVIEGEKVDGTSKDNGNGGLMW